MFRQFASVDVKTHSVDIDINTDTIYYHVTKQ